MGRTAGSPEGARCALDDFRDWFSATEAMTDEQSERVMARAKRLLRRPRFVVANLAMEAMNYLREAGDGQTVEWTGVVFEQFRDLGDPDYHFAWQCWLSAICGRRGRTGRRRVRG